LYVCELTDRFGSYGKIGLVLLEEKEESICIKLFLLSCRVMSRGIGDVMMSFIMKLTKAAGKDLFAEFIHTGKNRQMYITYKFTGFEECESGDPEILLKHRLDKIRDYPGFIEVTPPPVSIQSSNKLSLT
jgi:predicted enzyme involved in methoxymalonyl-ACP biosynthesis